jgi:hypothetical protein
MMVKKPLWSLGQVLCCRDDSFFVFEVIAMEPIEVVGYRVVNKVPNYSYQNSCVKPAQCLPHPAITHPASKFHRHLPRLVPRDGAEAL